MVAEFAVSKFMLLLVMSKIKISKFGDYSTQMTCSSMTYGGCFAVSIIYLPFFRVSDHILACNVTVYTFQGALAPILEKRGAFAACCLCLSGSTDH